MKQRIFNQGKGWYISASNYRDRDDKAYMNIFFPNTEPVYTPAGDNPFTFIDIDIQEQKYSSYKGKIGLTVFKYEIIREDGLTEVDNQEYAESMSTAYTKRFGGSVDSNMDLSPDDLPFY